MDAMCTELKGAADSKLKMQEENKKVLGWIRDTNDPEPSQDKVMEQTGLDDTNTNAGDWFLRTPEFETWLNGISSDPGGNRIFWLKGFSKSSSNILSSKN
jgi:hypothetical protein